MPIPNFFILQFFQEVALVFFVQLVKLVINLLQSLDNQLINFLLRNINLLIKSNRKLIYLFNYADRDICLQLFELFVLERLHILRVLLLEIGVGEAFEAGEGSGLCHWSRGRWRDSGNSMSACGACGTCLPLNVVFLDLGIIGSRCRLCRLRGLLHLAGECIEGQRVRHWHI